MVILKIYIGHLYFFWELSTQFFDPFSFYFFEFFVHSRYALSYIFCKLLHSIIFFFLISWGSICWLLTLFSEHESPCRKSLVISLSSNVFPASFSSNVTATGVTLSISKHWELIFVQCERFGSSFSLVHVDTHFPQHPLLKRQSFLQ